MEITYSNVIEVENPTPEMLDFCEANLVVPNPEYTRRIRMNLYIPTWLPSTLELYEKKGSTLILPYGMLGQIYSQFKDKAEFYDGFPTYESKNYKIVIEPLNWKGAYVPLYDYQEVAVRKMVDAQMGILQSPAGSGKTQMGLAMAVEIGKRTLWICHTRDLLKQSYDRAKQYIDESLLGMITEGHVHCGECITFATIQTLYKIDFHEFKHYFDVVIVDECHRVSGSPSSVTMYQQVLNGLAARHKYGLSATVHRSDGMIQATYALLGRVRYIVPDEAVAEKIMRVSVCRVDTGIALSQDCLNWDGTINYAKMISYLCERKERNQTIVDVLVDDDDKPSLILSDRVAHLETLMEMLPDYMREKAVMINGKSKKVDRDKALMDMRNYEKRYLFATYNLAKEGLDIPRLERLYLTTPHKDYAVITQAIGRIARTYKDKDVPVAYDFVDNFTFAQKGWKKRYAIYKKNKCEFVGWN